MDGVKLDAIDGGRAEEGEGRPWHANRSTS